MFNASVVFPLTATLILITQAQLLALPDTLGGCEKIGPTPPVLTAQPSIEKAAITAQTDLIKKSHFIFLGLISNRGNWTACRVSGAASWWGYYQLSWNYLQSQNTK